MKYEKEASTQIVHKSTAILGLAMCLTVLVGFAVFMLNK
jgi:hypothetical protein